ncbi:hypothetical protein ACFLZX_02850 [Nanoarchaeota archaeon]
MKVPLVIRKIGRFLRLPVDKRQIELEENAEEAREEEDILISITNKIVKLISAIEKCETLQEKLNDIIPSTPQKKEYDKTKRDVWNALKELSKEKIKITESINQMEVRLDEISAQTVDPEFKQKITSAKGGLRREGENITANISKIITITNEQKKTEDWVKLKKAIKTINGILISSLDRLKIIDEGILQLDLELLEMNNTLKYRIDGLIGQMEENPEVVLDKGFRHKIYTLLTKKDNREEGIRKLKRFALGLKITGRNLLIILFIYTIHQGVSNYFKKMEDIKTVREMEVVLNPAFDNGYFLRAAFNELDSAKKEQFKRQIAAVVKKKNLDQLNRYLDEKLQEYALEIYNVCIDAVYQSYIQTFGNLDEKQRVRFETNQKELGIELKTRAQVENEVLTQSGQTRESLVNAIQTMLRKYYPAHILEDDLPGFLDTIGDCINGNYEGCKFGLSAGVIDLDITNRAWDRIREQIDKEMLQPGIDKVKEKIKEQISPSNIWKKVEREFEITLNEPRRIPNFIQLVKSLATKPFIFLMYLFGFLIILRILFPGFSSAIRGGFRFIFTNNIKDIRRFVALGKKGG